MEGRGIFRLPSPLLILSAPRAGRAQPARYRGGMRKLRDVYRRRAVALPVDLALVVLFTVIGRASHDEAITPAGVFTTAWPFVLAVLAGWLLITLARLRHTAVWPAGVILWVVTLLGGIGLRLLGGGTAEGAFILVAGIVLALFLLLPRLLLGGWRGRDEDSLSA